MAADSPDRCTVLDDQLCLALYAASRAMTSRYRSLLEPFKLTYPQYLVLLVLCEDERSSLGAIGRRLRLESSTLSPLVKRLESMGLLTRSRSTIDERNISIDLTDQGQQLCVQISAVSEQISAATGLDLAQQVDLVNQLRTLEDHLRPESDPDD